MLVLHTPLDGAPIVAEATPKDVSTTWSGALAEFAPDAKEDDPTTH